MVFLVLLFPRWFMPRVYDGDGELNLNYVVDIDDC